ncbi:MAG: TIGR02266 family protein, partial [Deltaproteobacteria bacterium]|nr:TIGR02266 family protein [Deltaproteobacteria bacterium]
MDANEESLLVTADGKSPATFTQRRAYPRVAVEVEVTFASEHQFYTGLSHDLSEGGLFIATGTRLPPGTLVQLRFAAPGCEAPIETLAEVRWARESVSGGLPSGLGVRFLELSEAATAAIARFVKEREPYVYSDVAHELTPPLQASELLAVALPSRGARRARGAVAAVAVVGAIAALGAAGVLFARRFAAVTAAVAPPARRTPTSGPAS